jgi:hypothetical protein
VLSALQIITLTDNASAATLLKPIQGIPNFGFPILNKERLLLCPTLPSKGTRSCVEVIDFRTGFVNRTLVCSFQTLVRHRPENFPRYCQTYQACRRIPL